MIAILVLGALLCLLFMPRKQNDADVDADVEASPAQHLGSILGDALSAILYTAAAIALLLAAVSIVAPLDQLP